MAYFYGRAISGSFEEALTKVTDQLKKEGFGVLAQIDVKQTREPEA